MNLLYYIIITKYIYKRISRPHITGGIAYINIYNVYKLLYIYKNLYVKYNNIIYNI